MKYLRGYIDHHTKSIQGVVTMPAKDRNRRYTLNGRNICAYHKDVTSQVLRCFAFCDNCSVSLSWGNSSDKKAWQLKYCQHLGKGCPLKEALDSAADIS